MAKEKKTVALGIEMTKKMVVEFLQNHPDFLKENPALFSTLTPPEIDHGNGVVDFQKFIVGNLQKDVKQVKNKYDALVVAARDNMSTQLQVHNAVLGMIKARDLEHLLEVITMDLVRLFDVDVVRIAMESDVAEFYDSYYSEQNYSGISFIQTGSVDAAIPADEEVLLCPNTAEQAILGFDEIFVDCAALIQSCVLLRLELPRNQRNAILAFGVRHKDRFHPGQGVELLSFLGQIVEHQLDICLNESEREKL